MRIDSLPKTVLEALERRLESDPDGPYLDFEGTEVTAREIDEQANRLADALARLGVVRGDRVATLLENRPEQVVSLFGTLKLGAIHQPVNTAYRGEVLRHQLLAVVAQGAKSRLQHGADRGGIR